MNPIYESLVVYPLFCKILSLNRNIVQFKNWLAICRKKPAQTTKTVIFIIEERLEKLKSDHIGTFLPVYLELTNRNLIQNTFCQSNYQS
jgi:hypothetical protein